MAGLALEDSQFDAQAVWQQYAQAEGSRTGKLHSVLLDKFQIVCWFCVHYQTENSSINIASLFPLHSSIKLSLSTKPNCQDKIRPCLKTCALYRLTCSKVMITAVV